jgi:hypothetical protein
VAKVIIKFKNGEFLNLPADCIDIRDGWIMAWKGEFIVAMAKAEEVITCYLSEKKGDGI